MKGRKTLFTTALRKHICDLLARGHTIKTTCGACGISERAYHGHCAKDAAFLAATQRARFDGRVKIVSSILDDKDWRARAWYLERCYPEEFGRTAERPAAVEREPEPLRPIILNVTRGPDYDETVKRFGQRPAHLGKAPAVTEIDCSRR